MEEAAALETLETVTEALPPDIDFAALMTKLETIVTNQQSIIQLLIVLLALLSAFLIVSAMFHYLK